MKIVRRIILIISIAVALISGYVIVERLLELSAEKREFKEIAEMAEKEDIFKKNKDLVAWVKVKGTDIDYPVMHTPDDPEHYLHRNFEGEYSYSGVPFLDSRANINRSDNLLIYGHNMKNKTMFSTLFYYEDEEFYRDHKYISLKTKKGTRKYLIFAAAKTSIKSKKDKGFRYYEFIDANTEEEFNEYVSNVKEIAMYDTGVEVSPGEQLITLSTCSYHTKNGRLIVVGKRVK